MDHSHGVAARMLELEFTALTHVKVFAGETHVARTHQRTAIAVVACYSLVLNFRLLLQVLLLDGDRDVLLNLHLDHL